MRRLLLMTRSRTTLALAAGLAALPALAAAQAREVTTTGFDAQRTNWIRSDVRINHAAIADGSFKFLWKHTFPGEPQQLQSLTQPVLQDFLVGYVGFKSLAFVGGANDDALRHRHRSGQAVLDHAPDVDGGGRQHARQHLGAVPAASFAAPSRVTPRAPTAVRRLRRWRRRPRRRAPSASPARAPRC